MTKKKYANLDCILLIDDDRPTNFYHQLVIDEVKIDTSVTAVTSGKDAISFLTSTNKFTEKREPNPGIIFLDINMPGMNGFDFLEAYEKISPGNNNKTIVVMLTTSVNPSDREKAAAYKSVSGFFIKPLTEEMVTEVVSTYFNGLG
ncbi:response regulator [soil metagenome]